MKIINSKRLSYSLMTRNDADVMFQINQDPEVMRYINGGKTTSKEDIQNIFVPRMERYRNEEKGWGLWKVSTLDDLEFIGFILIRPMGFFTDSPEYKNIELGWRFIRKYWGFGYATEAAEHIKQAINKVDDIKQFTAFAMKDNSASIKIMEKLGMKYIKTDIHKDPLGDEEVVFYQLMVK